MSEADLRAERTASQWIASILVYLEWRAGHAWTRTSHRFHPEVEYYVRGIRCVRECWYSPEPEPYLKKLPQSVKSEYKRAA